MSDSADAAAEGVPLVVSRSGFVTAAAFGLLLTSVTGFAAESAQSQPAARCLSASVPKPVTSGQTSSSQSQVRWAAGRNVAKYRLHWSPAPFGKWPGFDPYTRWVGRTARMTAVGLPAVGSGDKFMNVAYGNPIFARLQVNNGCDSTIHQSPYVPVWPKPKGPGNATSGDALAVGEYNLELDPTTANNNTKMTDMASNIASKNLDIVLLEEANTTTAKNMVAKLGASWAVVTSGNTVLTAPGVRTGVNQQIIYRSDRFSEAASGVLGQADDNNASTPLPTPWARLMPVSGAPSQGIFLVAAHLEESPSTNPATKKAAAHNAAVALLNGIATANQPALPAIVGGDLKGNFQDYCDERSRPACVGEGQPTFIRAGYYDAQAAVTKVGIQYGTVNKHVANQPANLSGFGGRADYILLKGFPGSLRYEVVHKTYGDGSATYQPDHNLIYANVFIPHTA